MNPELLFTRLRAAAAALSARQITTLAIVFLAVVGLTIWSAYSLNTPTYSVLFSDMDAESAASVVSRLKSEQVPYSLEDGGRSVLVPLDRVDELRLDFASQGLPASGRIGFELFDQTAFGVTDFQEHVNYRRALEGELARTIATIDEVAGARVHIAMPQRSLFTGRDEGAKASVVLRLRNNRQLPSSAVNAIRGLMSASVESLEPGAVVIIDTFGRPLSRPEENAEQADGLPLERQQRIERELAASVVGLIEPIVGAGRVRVNVSARLRAQTEEQTEERWDPTPVVRSRQSVTQVGAVAALPAQGIAGARSNLPPEQSSSGAVPAPAGAAPPAVSPGSQLAETTNYEVSKLTRHSLQPRGEIEKLSVAVVLDDVRDEAAPDAQGKPRSPAEMEKIQALVAAAVGLDSARGDQLTVENIAFDMVPVDEAPAPTVWQQYGPPAMEVGRITGIVVIALVALFFVIRPAVNAALARGVPQTVGALPVPRTVHDLEADLDAQLEGVAGAHARRLPVLTKRVAALTEREPENAARLLRTWLSEDER